MMAIALLIVVVMILIVYYIKSSDTVVENFVRPVIHKTTDKPHQQPGRSTDMSIGTRHYEDTAVIRPQIKQAPNGVGVGVKARSSAEMKKFYAGEHTRFDVQN